MESFIGSSAKYNQQSAKHSFGEEARRAMQFHFEIDRRHWIVAHGILRRLWALS